MSKSTQANVTVHTNPIYGIRQYRNPLYHLFHSAEGLFKAAIEFFEKSSHLAPKEKREKSARAFYTAAALYIQAQRYDELLTRLEKLDDIKMSYSDEEQEDSEDEADKDEDMLLSFIAHILTQIPATAVLSTAHRLLLLEHDKKILETLDEAQTSDHTNQNREKILRRMLAHAQMIEKSADISEEERENMREMITVWATRVNSVTPTNSHEFPVQKHASRKKVQFATESVFGFFDKENTSQQVNHIACFAEPIEMPVTWAISNAVALLEQPPIHSVIMKKCSDLIDHATQHYSETKNYTALVEALDLLLKTIQKVPEKNKKYMPLLTPSLLYMMKQLPAEATLTPEQHLFIAEQLFANNELLLESDERIKKCDERMNFPNAARDINENRYLERAQAHCRAADSTPTVSPLRITTR
ncbi:MAG TPA: hypothetical protein VJN02_11680 [Gammaproteobacteria bacterium]|nr:MAG: hypothetical protein A3E83_07050 [Gammaproteobacteria bacterium RIFCSPHIGHO2_12_FULL_41_20]HLB43482.1 hypothetical protein [Gammaproteobacteria bacterium]